MTIKTWLEWAAQDADRRGLQNMRPLFEGLARSTAALRLADWNDDASGQNDRQHLRQNDSHQITPSGTQQIRQHDGPHDPTPATDVR